MAEILIIEDDDATRTFFVRSLQHFGKIEHASRLDEALQAVDTKRYDLIIIDAHLRGRDGLRVLDHVREGKQNESTPTFVVTSDVSVGTRLRAGKHASFFVQKPVRMPLLVTLIAGVLKVDPRTGAASTSTAGGQASAAPTPSSSPGPGVRSAVTTANRAAAPEPAAAPLPMDGDVAEPAPAAPARGGFFSGISGLFRSSPSRSSS